MSLTFNGGTHDVVIFKQGQRFDRTNLSYFFNSITAVEVKLAVGENSTIRVTIEPSFDDAIKILSSGLLGIGLSQLGQLPEKPQNGSGQTKIVSSSPLSSQVSQAAEIGFSKADLEKAVAPFIGVKFLYPGQTDSDGSAAETSWFTGPCFTPHLEISDGTITIVMVAEATVAFLKLIQGTSSFSNEPALDVIKKLAEPMNIDVTFDEDDTETEDFLQNTMISGIYNEPKMQTIRNILYRLDCYWATPSGEGKEPKSELRIKSRKSISESQIGFSFVMFRQIYPSRNVIPIYNLSLESGTTLFLPQGAFGSFQRGVNESTKKVEKVSVGPSDYDGKSMSGTNTTGGTLPKGDPAFGGATGITNDSDPELTGSSTPYYSRGVSKNNAEDIKGATKRAIFNGVAYRLTVPGLPKLRVMGAAQVVIGDNIPGLSAVGWTETITHKSDGGGWTSEILFRQTGGAVDTAAVSNFSNKKTENLLSDNNPPGKVVSGIPIERLS